MTDLAATELAGAAVTLAATHFASGNLTEALDALDIALSHAPDDAETIQFRAVVLSGLGRLDEAVAGYDQALALRPELFEALYNRGTVLLEQRQFARAVHSLDAALAQRPEDTGALNNRGKALLALYQPADALESFERAVAASGGGVEFIHNCGAALQALGRGEEALARFEEALVRDPGHCVALSNYAGLLRSTGRYVAAAAATARLVAVAPETPFALGNLLHAKLLQSDWSGLDGLVTAIDHAVAAGRPAVAPFEYLTVARTARAMHRAAEIYTAHHFPPQPRQFAAPARRGARDRRIRLGYLSSDYRRHATAQLVVELFECHDRARFEVIGFDTVGDDPSPIRRRIDAACDGMVDIAGLGSEAAADAVAATGIDILINLNGYSGRQRTDIFAQRPAPLQVNYLGFPGGMGASYIDYIIGDRFVTPPEHAAWFTERIVVLPDSYQVNDRQRPIAAYKPSRVEILLPESGFVFCCFNHAFKILPEIFDIWMGLLRDIAGSVLWLMGDNAEAEANLRRAAVARGVDPARIVFAPRLALDEHLARHVCADLFLDTLPTNAHTTASDALWAGLPVLTCRGESFAGLVAASLLHAVGLPELVADSLPDYAQRARRLAVMTGLLADIRARLAQGRATAPLFDTTRTTRHIESAYTTMWARHQNGLKPAPFTVSPLDQDHAS